MNDNTRGETDEDSLIYEVSDEALEAAATDGLLASRSKSTICWLVCCDISVAYPSDSSRHHDKAR
jgi:hypothetical protein